MRLVITRVFPEPAPARINSGPSTCTTAARCSGLRAAKRSIGTRARDLGSGRATKNCPVRAYHRPAFAHLILGASARQARGALDQHELRRGKLRRDVLQLALIPSADPNPYS